MASRRRAEELILQRRVTVNGKTVTELGTKVEPGDVVFFDGRPVEPEPLEYHLLNKPAGVVTTVTDTHSRRTVVELVPSAVRLFPVGRLDFDTTGFIILTNDGELAHRLMHPRFEVDKVYRARVEGVPDEEDLRKLREGVLLEDGLTAPARAELMEITNSHSVVEITLHEGRKRQVRRMLAAVGHPVMALHRIKYVTLTDETLPEGESRPLTPAEIGQLKKLVKEEH